MQCKLIKAKQGGLLGETEAAHRQEEPQGTEQASSGALGPGTRA